MSETRTSAHEEQEESYFVSMTDLMVGMLFIFIIMLMAFALNLKEQQNKVDEATERLTKANLARAELLRKLEDALKKEGVTVLVDIQNGILRLPESILFRQGEYRLDAKGKDAMRKVAMHLALLLPSYACVRDEHGPRCPPEIAARLETIFIEGHTDNVPVSSRLSATIADNWDLSARRAIEVYRHLTAERPDLERYETDRSAGVRTEKLLGVSGYAERRPVSSEDTDSARANNRRIDLRFIMATPDPEEAQRFRDKYGASRKGK